MNLISAEYLDEPDPYEQVIALRAVCHSHPNVILIAIDCPTASRPVDPGVHLFVEYLMPHCQQTRQGYMGTQVDQHHVEESPLRSLLNFADMPPKRRGDVDHTTYKAKCPHCDFDVEVRDNTLGAIATGLFDHYAAALGVGRRCNLTVTNLNEVIRLAGSK